MPDARRLEKFFANATERKSDGNCRYSDGLHAGGLKCTAVRRLDSDVRHRGWWLGRSCGGECRLRPNTINAENARRRHDCRANDAWARARLPPESALAPPGTGGRCCFPNFGITATNADGRSVRSRWLLVLRGRLAPLFSPLPEYPENDERRDGDDGREFIVFGSVQGLNHMWSQNIADGHCQERPNQ